MLRGRYYSVHPQCRQFLESSRRPYLPAPGYGFACIAAIRNCPSKNSLLC